MPLIDAGAAADFDPWTDDYRPNHKAIDVEDIEKELRRLVRQGLPLSRQRAGDILPHLRSIAARSVHPYDRSSRVNALNQQLARLLIEREDDDGQGLRTLFCVSKGTRGTNLSTRRARAADELGYDHDHFRKKIEPRLIAEFADAVYEDLLRYKQQTRRALNAQEPVGDTPDLTEKHLTHEEELISRIWQHVYGLRAELIAQYRLEQENGYEQRVEEHKQNASAEMASIRSLVEQYRDTYGQDFIKHGEAEFALDRLINFAL